MSLGQAVAQPWDGITAISSAVAAVAALFAVVLSGRQWTKDRSARAQDRAEDLANDWVIKPIQSAADDFLSDVSRVFHARFPEVHHLLEANAAISEIEATIAKLVEEFNETYREFRRRVLLRVQSALDSDRAATIVAKLDSLQDETTLALNCLPSKLHRETAQATTEGAVVALVRAVLDGVRSQ